MNDPKMLTNPRPLPTRRPLKRGAKVKWIPTSFRFSPELHKFLKDEAERQSVDMVYLVTEVLEQFRSFMLASKKYKR